MFPAVPDPLRYDQPATPGAPQPTPLERVTRQPQAYFQRMSSPSPSHLRDQESRQLRPVFAVVGIGHRGVSERYSKIGQFQIPPACPVPLRGPIVHAKQGIISLPTKSRPLYINYFSLNNSMTKRAPKRNVKTTLAVPAPTNIRCVFRHRCLHDDSIEHA